jgi:NADH:ubiquinone oxidoreductase subunit F (NADH-binding)
MDVDARVLDPEPVTTLADYERAGGGRALEAARRAEPEAVIATVEDAGLRGRGGAGFPTGTKWRTVFENRSPVVPATVVVNAAEGEPGTFKDRAILRRNPYRALEGALVAAEVLGADAVVVATKASFRREIDRLRSAIAELREAGWTEGVDVVIVEGPGHYLYGEETALLEVVAGRNPFPRIAPPFRHGVDEPEPDTKSAADTQMAGPDPTSVVPPALVNNVETLSNIPGIVADGPGWFRSAGTDRSPGTVVCTISGRTKRHGVLEVPLGTPLLEVIEAAGGAPSPGDRFVAALSGVANPLVPEAQLATPVSYEAMEEIGSGLGAAGFIVFDDTTDLAAVAAGVARFLAVESCGQCTPCKQDGLALADLLARVAGTGADEHDLTAIEDHLATVTDEARCYLAHQQQRVVDSVLRLFPEGLRAHLAREAPAAEPELIVPIVDIDGDVAALDTGHRTKQPDWTHDEVYSGQSPADRVRLSSSEVL